MSKNTFAPIVKFVENTDGNRLAVSAIHAIQGEIKNTMDTERNRKTTVGISEIGNPCNKCVARKLSGLYAKPVSLYTDGWKAQIGTFGHAGLEEHFTNLAGLNVNGAKLDIHLEQRVVVLDDPRLNLNGSCDFYATDGDKFGVVVDWKFLGKSTLEPMQKGTIKQVYKVQVHTYGLGYELLGMPVSHVCVYALPRDGELSDAAPVIVEYDRQIAVDALARITSMLDAADALEAAYPGEGWERLIRAQSTAGSCFDCRSYESSEKEDFFGSWMQ